MHVKYTLSTDTVNSTQQFADALVSIDTLGDAIEAVTEYQFRDGPIDVG